MITLKTVVIYTASLLVFFIVAFGPLVWTVVHTGPDDLEEIDSFVFTLTIGWTIVCLLIMFVLVGVG